MQSRRAGMNVMTPYVYVLPCVILLGVFVYIPLVANFYYSAFSFSALSPTKSFVGLQNYKTLVSDPVVGTALINNIWYCIISVAIQVLLALVIASLLEDKLFSKISTVLRTTYFLPVLISMTVVALLFSFVYHPKIGLINAALKFFGSEERFLYRYQWVNGRYIMHAGLGLVDESREGGQLLSAADIPYRALVDSRRMEAYMKHAILLDSEHNTNLALATTDAELRDGYEMIREVSERTGVPVIYTSGKKQFLDRFLAEGHDPKYIGTPVAIDTYMQRDWDSWVHSLDQNPSNPRPGNFYRTNMD